MGDVDALWSFSDALDMLLFKMSELRSSLEETLVLASLVSIGSVSVGTPVTAILWGLGFGRGLGRGLGLAAEGGGNLNAVPLGEVRGSLGDVADGISFGETSGSFGDLSLWEFTTSFGDTSGSLGEVTLSVGDFFSVGDLELVLYEETGMADDFASGGVGALPLECTGFLLVGIGRTLGPSAVLVVGDGLVAVGGGDLGDALVPGGDFTGSVGVVFFSLNFPICPNPGRTMGLATAPGGSLLAGLGGVLVEGPFTCSSSSFTSFNGFGSVESVNINS